MEPIDVKTWAFMSAMDVLDARNKAVQVEDIIDVARKIVDYCNS